jgi:hypothetical protein
MPIKVECTIEITGGKRYEILVSEEDNWCLCPGCNKPLTGLRETVQWTWDDKRQVWAHDMYDLPYAHCEGCRLAIHAGFDRDYVFEWGEDTP